MSGHPYRPLFVENDVKVAYTLTPEELREAIIDFVEKKIDSELEGYPDVWVGAGDNRSEDFVLKMGSNYALSAVAITLIEDVK
jgi:hypothetical protein